VPELATTLVSKLRGHDEVGLGTILGSNIFNGLLIVAVAAIICPTTIKWHEVAIAVVFGVLAVLVTCPSQNGFIERRRVFVLLGLYAAYLVATVQNNMEAPSRFEGENRCLSWRDKIARPSFEPLQRGGVG